MPPSKTQMIDFITCRMTRAYTLYGRDGRAAAEAVKERPTATKLPLDDITS